MENKIESVFVTEQTKKLVWKKPEIKHLSVSLDTADGFGSGPDQTSPSPMTN